MSMIIIIIHYYDLFTCSHGNRVRLISLWCIHVVVTAAMSGWPEAAHAQSS